MKRRRGWSAVEVILASAVASGVMLAAGTLWGTMNRRTGQDLTRAALRAQLEGYASILERNIRQSSQATVISRAGQNMLCLRMFFHTTDSYASSPQPIRVDPTGQIAYDASNMTLFFMSDAALLPNLNGAPMASYVSADPVTGGMSPIASSFRDLDGRSFFPAIRSQSFTVNPTNQTVTFTLVAGSRNRMMGSAGAPAGPGATELTLTRTVGWRYSP